MAETEQQPQPEPSMEEILSSIRRIISEDVPPEPESVAIAPQAPDDAILDLTQMLADDGSVVQVSPKNLEIQLEDDLPPAAAMVMVPEPDTQAPPEPSYEAEPETMPEPIIEAPVAPPEAAPVSFSSPAAPSPVRMSAAPVASDDADSLMSGKAQEKAASALSRLAQAVEAERAADIASLPLGEGQKTLEAMVLTLMRPMLKQWMDDNLPLLVERIVEKEIAHLMKRVDE